MEVCRLCLDLLQDTNFLQIDKNYGIIVNTVLPELNLKISNNPVACKDCTSTVELVHKFKTKCIENEQLIKQKCNGETNGELKLSLKEILHGVNLGEVVMTEKTKERICRTCLDSIEDESFTVLQPSKPDAYLDSMLNMCLPELNLTLSEGPVMCEKCLNSLQKFHQLRTTCLDVEEKLKNYCKINGTNSSAQINLHSVLEQSSLNNKEVETPTFFKVKSEPLSISKSGNSEFVPVNPEFKTGVKTEQIDDIDMETSNDDSSVKLDSVKEEEVEIKSEESKSTAGKSLRLGNNLNAYQEDDEDELTCNYCLKTFSTRFNLARHKITQHHKKNNLKKFHCHICDMKYHHKSILEKHIRSRHTGERPFQCQLCPKAFAAQTNLNNHLKTHQGIRPYTCALCGHQFSQKSNLKKHIKGHSGREKTVECPVCHKMFATKYNLQSHMEIHDGEKPYFCDICDQSFRHLTPLQVHRRSHLGKRIYTCSTCGMQFKYQSGLTIHEKTHYGDKPFACPICGKRFVKESIVTSHLTLHTGEKPYECFMCGNKYADKSKLNYHLKKKCLKGISLSIKAC